MTVMQKNLDIYGHDPIPWSRPLKALTPAGAVGVATAEPHGATRWRFTDEEGPSIATQ